MAKVQFVIILTMALGAQGLIQSPHEDAASLVRQMGVTSDSQAWVAGSAQASALARAPARAPAPALSQNAASLVEQGTKGVEPHWQTTIYTTISALTSGFELPLVSVLNGSAYVMDLCFGELSPQCMPGVVDSGSHTFLVRSSKCAVCQPPFYDSSKSPTNVHSSKSIMLFEDINATVAVSSETVGLVPRPSVSSTALKVRFAHAQIFELLNFTTDADTATDDDVTRDAFFRDGISGVWGFSPAAVGFLYAVGIEGFTICLPRKLTANGTIVFNPSIPTLAGIPVIKDGQWSVSLTNMKLLNNQGTQHHLGCKSGCVAHLDSGSTFITLPSELVDSLTEQVHSGKVACDKLSTLPFLEFNLGEQKVTLPPAAYVTIVNSSLIPSFLNQRLIVAPKHNQHMTCVFMLTKDSLRPKEIILGLPFFRYFAVTFAVRAIHISQHNDDCAAHRAASDNRAASDGQLLNARHRVAATLEDKPTSIAHVLDMNQFRLYLGLDAGMVLLGTPEVKAAIASAVAPTPTPTPAPTPSPTPAPACKLGDYWCGVLEQAGLTLDQRSLTRSSTTDEETQRQWYYNGASTKVGLGGSNQKCDHTTLVCAGGLTFGYGFHTFGYGIQQGREVLKAIQAGAQGASVENEVADEFGGVEVADEFGGVHGNDHGAEDDGRLEPIILTTIYTTFQPPDVDIGQVAAVSA